MLPPRNILTFSVFFRRSFAAFALLLTLCVAQKVHAAATVVDLGSLGGRYTTPNDINEKGQIVGVAEVKVGTLNRPHAFVYEGGQLTDIGTPMGYDSSVATAINNSGVIVGSCSTNDGDLPTRAFLYQDGQFQLLPILDFQSSFATDINDDGTIVGVCTRDSGRTRAFRYKNNQTVDIGSAISAQDDSVAYRVNNSGQILIGISSTIVSNSLRTTRERLRERF